MDKELVKIKGTGDGIKIYLDAVAPISDITTTLYDVLGRYRQFFSGGSCNVYVTGRELSTSDKMRFEAMIKASLPKCTIDFGDGSVSTERSEERTLELPPDFEEKAREEAEEGERFKLEAQDRALRNFKASRARFYQRDVRKGERLESDGHMVLMGNVEQGGKLTAEGNIIVFGKLYGSAHAGGRTVREAYVAAVDMRPEDIRIADEHAYFEKSNFTGGTAKAYLADGRIVGENLDICN